MTLQFPSDPINGAVSGDYTYDATKGAWRKNAALPVSVTHSDVAPSNPREGDQWWKSDEGTLFTYYNDGSSSQWVESTNVVANVEPNPIPAGAMMAWGSDTIPSNWLLCDGSAISRSTYASLFAAIGTQYGSGDGTTTFNLPNLHGRTIVGRDSTQTEFDVLGETGGAKTHVLTQSQMPNHTHTFSGTTSGESGHTHAVVGLRINDGGSGVQLVAQSDGNVVIYSGGAAQGFGGRALSGNFREWSIGNASESKQTTGSSGHTHTYSGTTSSSGSGEAHNNLQPYIVLNYIIKFSAGETPGDSQLAVRVGTLETQNNATPISYNYVINGAFDIWQRGTSATTDAGNTYKTADRWVGYKNNAGATESRQLSGLTGFQYCGRYQRNSGSSDTQQLWAYQTLETVNSIPLAGKTVTLSFYARDGENYSPTNSGLLVQLRSGTGVDQNALSGFTGSATPINQTAILTTSWQRFSFTATLNSNITELGVVFIATPTGTAGANDWFEITGVQLEEGSYATPFRRNAPSIQAELAACQRYYYRSAQAYGFYNIFNSGNMQSTTFRFPVTMRTSSPAVTVYDNVGTVNRITIANAGGTSQNGITPPATLQLSSDGFMWVAGGMGGTVGNNGMVYMSRFDASAEL